MRCSTKSLKWNWFNLVEIVTPPHTTPFQELYVSFILHILSGSISHCSLPIVVPLHQPLLRVAPVHLPTHPGARPIHSLKMTGQKLDSSLPVQMTDASSWWLQLCCPQGWKRQRRRLDSAPVQLTSSSQIGPEPGPNRAFPELRRGAPQSSSRHTTAACTRSQPSSHTVPHWSLYRTSTRPAQDPGPPTRRTCHSPETQREEGGNCL